MTEEMLQKAMALFDTPEKWNAFVELANEKDNIQNRWFKKLQQKLVSLTYADDKHPEWTCNFWGFWDIEWILTGNRKNYISLHSWAGIRCRLFLHCDDSDKIVKANKLLNNDSRISKLMSQFNIISKDSKDTEVPLEGNVIFDFDEYDIFKSYYGDWKDKNNILSAFAWYAYNDTDNVARQIMEQVDKIRTPEMTDLFRKVDELLNEEDS